MMIGNSPRRRIGVTDAMVVMKDVCRLPDDEAQAVLKWAALALLRAGVADGPVRKPQAKRRGSPRRS